METLVMSFTLLVGSVVIAVLAGTLPFLWWRVQKLESQIDTLDETLAEFLGRVLPEDSKK